MVENDLEEKGGGEGGGVLNNCRQIRINVPLMMSHLSFNKSGEIARKISVSLPHH